MVRLAGGHHEQDAVGTVALPAGLDGPLHRPLPDGDGGEFHVFQEVAHLFAAPEPLHQLVGVLKLRHPLGTAEVGDLKAFKTGQHQLFRHPEFGCRWG